MTETKANASDQAILEMYQYLTRNKAEREAGRKAYFAKAMREQRAKSREAKMSGKARTTPKFAREALADAAMRILATEGPGLAQIREVLLEAFAATPAYVATIEGLVIAGKLKPKLVPLNPSKSALAKQGLADRLPERSQAKQKVPTSVVKFGSPTFKENAEDDEFRPPDFLLRER